MNKRLIEQLAKEHQPKKNSNIQYNIFTPIPLYWGIKDKCIERYLMAENTTKGTIQTLGIAAWDENGVRTCTPYGKETELYRRVVGYIDLIEYTGKTRIEFIILIDEELDE